MSHRLDAATLRAVAEQRGDRTDNQIAQRAGLPKATLSRLINGIGEPTVTTVMRLARCYAVSVESLLRETNPDLAMSA